MKCPNSLAPEQLLVTLNARISSLTRARQFADAVRVFAGVHSSPDFVPDHYSLASALAACAGLRASGAAAGAQLHAHAIRSGLLSFPHVANSLLSFYSKSHDPNSAHHLFNTISYPDAYSCTTLLSAYAKAGQVRHAFLLFERMPHGSTAIWNALITGCAQHGHGGMAFDLFIRMHRLGVRHDQYSFASVISLCDSLELVGFGKQLHSMVLRTGFIAAKVSVINTLVTMYLDLGLISEAYNVFGEAGICEEITYNALISGLMRWGREEEAFMMLKEMREEACLCPNELTFVSVLTACSSKEVGSQVYADAIKLGLEASVLVGNAAVTMYSNCKDFVSAQKIFERIDEKDIVSWNSMISGYSKENCYKSAIAIYHRMRSGGIEPDDFTYGSLLACIGSSEHAKMIHALVTKNGTVSSIEVQNALICTYSKCVEVDCANRVFSRMTLRNLISWNSIISGFMLNGFPMRGLEFFSTLMRSGLKPNSYTLSIVLSICAAISDLRLGKELHGYIFRSGSACETSLGNSLISMYSKCGNLNCSSKVFNGIPQIDLVSWNSIIAAFAQNGDECKAISYFKAMQGSETVPDGVTFTILLSACSHAGLVEEGQLIFSAMIEDYAIEPGVDHYSCIIDLLSRSGHLDEVERLVNSIPYRLDSQIWWILLSTCSTYGNVRLGRIAAHSLLENEPENPAVYVLLSNIEAANGKWEEALNVREDMKDKGVLKKPGCSWTENTFSV